MHSTAGAEVEIGTEEEVKVGAEAEVGVGAEVGTEEEAEVEPELEAELEAEAVVTLLLTSLCPTVLLQSALSFRCIPLLLANQFPIMPPVKHFTCFLPLLPPPSPFSPSLISSHFLAVARVHLH